MSINATNVMLNSTHSYRIKNESIRTKRRPVRQRTRNGTSEDELLYVVQHRFEWTVRFTAVLTTIARAHVTTSADTEVGTRCRGTSTGQVCLQVDRACYHMCRCVTNVRIIG